MAPRRRVQCTICCHEQRHRIELALVSGASREAIGRKFDVSPDAAGRHNRNHITDERRAQLVAGPLRLHELAEKAQEADLALVDYLSMLRSSLFEQYLQAAEVGDRNGFTTIAGRLTDVLRLEGQVSGEIAKATSCVTNNTVVFSSPIMADIEQVLVERLKPHPEALRSVFEGIEALRSQRLGTPARLVLEHAPA